jgi:hypothetical protein
LQRKSTKSELTYAFEVAVVQQQRYSGGLRIGLTTAEWNLRDITDASSMVVGTTATASDTPYNPEYNGKTIIAGLEGESYYA